MRPNIESYARKRYGLPDDWRWISLERVGGDRPEDWFATNITGAVPGGVFKRGPRKGKPNWKLPRSKEMTLTVTDAEYDAYLLDWERDSGMCHRCGGKGQESIWLGKAGPTIRTCKRCGGDGAARDA